ncbi:hypothetical protein SAMN05892883_3793 [Jatrophihabitans sp. GAS493]|uniref:hypothetical protein n=1 Tax=Jatrophihabitans sp. GAS493 TaxID=1907575 RepID=UPI000BB8E992|nr:hypothetical protein [Jatrophihabitans sp. GAS493]SOD74607.1 hypothetical protein SAMN05892883_3793 [Jatrophihabitans sp. GAS493]
MFAKVTAALLILSTAAVLCGCTSSTSTPPPSKSPTSAAKTSASKASASPLPVQNPLPSPGQIPNDVKLRRQVSITSCTAKPGGWQAKGKAVNTGGKKVILTITVFFTTTSATVLDYATTKVSVPAGGTADWTAAATFAAEPTMRCVLRGVG